jgi:ethanolamine-phosphate phospho-lyase
MKEILKTYYGIEATEIKKLDGYDNVNYLVKTHDSKYIFKTYAFNSEIWELVVSESDILTSLGNGRFPKPIHSTKGDAVQTIEYNGKKIIIRLLSFLEGNFLAEVSHTSELFESFGSFLAELDQQLLDQKNYVIKSRKFEWDLQHLYLIEPFIQDIPKPNDRKLVAYFVQQYRELVVPAIPLLRKSLIHNDANDRNVLVTDGKVTGIIDFGDIACAPLINELAVAITYAIMGKNDPLNWAGFILKGFHKSIPLTPEETDLLYYLIAGRLCLSVCNAANSKKLDPGNSYISVSEQSAWALLHRWLEINPILASKVFRESIGFSVQSQEPVEQKIALRHRFISPVVSVSYSKPIYMERAAFQYMYDGYGHTFLDAYNNIPHVGHMHPRVVEAGQRQMAKLNTNTRYVYDLLQTYSEKLLSKFPSELNKVFFVNSGSAASDLAIRLARHHTKCDNIMVMEHGYHGHTMTGIEISDYKFSNKKGPGQKPWILKAPIPDTYWGKYQGDNAGMDYARDAARFNMSFW